MSDDLPPSGPAFQTVAQIIALLEPLSVDDRRHVLQTVTTWFRLDAGVVAPPQRAASQTVASLGSGIASEATDEKFANRKVQSVKDFIFEKAPNTETERVACLAYYLTHFLDTPHFQNVQISNLNTDAAQRKLSNPGYAVGNAMRDGFVVAAPKAGFKQLSAMGERFVQLLPDREAASNVRKRMASRRQKRPNPSDSDTPPKE